MRHILLIIFLLQKVVKQQSSATLQPDKQIISYEILIEEQDKIRINGYLHATLREDQAFSYGVWSRYNPLTPITQIGKIGVFDSPCFHLHSAMSNINKIIIFLNYDCLDQENRQITKNIRFIDDNGVDHYYIIQIDPDQYESNWYFFSIMILPHKGMVKMFVMHEDKSIFYTEIRAKFPYLEKNLKLIFGGGADGYYFSEQISQSYFPGPLNIQVPSSVPSFIANPQEQGWTFKFNQGCKMPVDFKLFDLISFEKEKVSLFSMQQKNINYFLFVGWIKVIKIVQIDQEFTYKFLKLTTTSNNKKITDDNLSPFCLYYLISQLGNEMIFTTYSYTFPSVNFDFTQNPFLIKESIKLYDNIQVWQYLKIELDQDFISFMIVFQEEFRATYELKIQVVQFKNVMFSLQVGNLLQRKDNYINFIASQFKFSNCDQVDFFEVCDVSCLECDGPTSKDCLSCSITSTRFYQPKLKQCDCPYSTVDKNKCLTHQDLNFNIIEGVKQKTIICPFGYFKNEDLECIQCPSIINTSQITCLECLNNPNQWINMLYCKSSLLSYNGQSFRQIEGDIQYFTFDGNQIHYCDYCQESCLDQECLLNNLLSVNNILFCYSPTNQNCYACRINNCIICGVLDNQIFTCLKCQEGFEFINGKCVRMGFGLMRICLDNCAICTVSYTCDFCFLPYYLIHDKSKCQLCNIPNCQYCFEFQIDDIKTNTLQNDFIEFKSDHNTRIGCSLCIDGFNYDFLSEKCVQNISNIKNCIRFYTEFSGQEKCLLSAVNDFNVAPQIINCDQYVANCEQCLQTPNQNLQCIICEKGYSASYLSGQCQPCNVLNAEYCLDGSLKYDYWVQLIQSFFMSFLPDKQMYGFQEARGIVITAALTCKKGFKVNRAVCLLDCDDQCLSCQAQNNDTIYFFFCEVCPKNLYGFPNLSVNQGNCLICPQLCLNCVQRTNDEIQSINPYFISNAQNIQYSYKCLQSIPDSNITIDSETQVAKYCFDASCNTIFEYKVIDQIIQVQHNDISAVFDRFQLGIVMYYENNIDIDYCNKMGIQGIQITVEIKVKQFSPITQFPIFLKESIFSLKYTIFHLKGNVKPGTIISRPFTFFQFDIVKWENIKHTSEPGMSIILLNNGQSVDLEIKNSIFEGSSQNQTFIQNQNFENLRIQNVTLYNLSLSNMVWLEFKTTNQYAEILIEQFTILNCVFENVTIFSLLQNAKSLQFNKVQIINSEFVNTVFISYNLSTYFIRNNTINDLMIKDCYFYASAFLIQINTHSFQINKFSLQTSDLEDTVFILTDSNAIIIELEIFDIYFYFSEFFRALVLRDDEVNYKFGNLQIHESTFQYSTLFYIHPMNIEQNTIQIEFTSIQHSLLNNSYSEKIVNLYDIKCSKLLIQGVTITDSINISYFNVYQTQVIEVYNIIYKNMKQEFQLQSLQECKKNSNISSSLIQIQGYFEILMNNLQIVNQYSVDTSLIQIFSDLLFRRDGESTVTIQSVIFHGNILIKQTLGNIFSLLVLNFDFPQIITLNDITFEENFFNQLVDDPSKTAAGLIYINSYLSSVELLFIYCNSNGLFNSQQPFLMINSLTQDYQHLYFQNFNLISEQILKKYYQFQLDLNNIYIQFFNQIFPLSNVGIFQIITSQVNFENATFYNSQAYSRCLFDIATQGEGIITLNNIQITNISSSLLQNNQIEGCITISSQNSKLYLEVRNVRLTQVYNRLDSSIFTIFPSKKQNKIYIYNIEVIDCFSFVNQFLFIQFQKESQSYLQIEKVVIKNDEKSLANYLQNILFPSTLEISKIQSENAIFYVQNGNLQFNDIYITGIIISQIFQLSGQENRKVVDIFIQNIQTLYPVSLIKINQMMDKNGSLIIQNLKIINTTQIFVADEIAQMNFNDTFYLVYDPGKCGFNIQQQIAKQKQTIIDLIQFFNSESITSGSLISIAGFSKIIKLLQIAISDNFCNFCFDGLIFLSENQGSLMLVKELLCNNNSIKQYGCLVIKNDQYNQQLAMKNSAFFKNKGSIGGGFYSQNVQIAIKYSIFFENEATDKAGAIFLSSNVKDFLIEKCLILSNLAQIAGGIYIEGLNHLTQSNFKQSIINFNRANYFSDNLVEAPDHIALRINWIDMKSIIPENGKNDQKNIQILLIPPYQLIKAKGPLTTSLYFPSGQQIKNFMLFDIKGRIFKQYIHQFSVVLKNSLNEDLLGSDQNECSIFSTVQNEINFDQLNLKSQIVDEVSYNTQQNYFDLTNLKVTHNPYNNSKLQITLECTSGIEGESLFYLMNVKTFKCQQGEFFTKNECKICEPTYGFYSVTINATQCSIFDQTKFSNITSNEIKLNKGYWRPKHTSNIVELCFKKVNYCIGGWGVGNSLCYPGCIGGLCEECDIYNIQGNGYYALSDTNLCKICSEQSYQYIKLVFLLLWSFISLLLTLKSNRQTSKTFARLRATTTLYEILFKLSKGISQIQLDLESILLKMFFNYLWIFSVIFTFNISFDFSFSALDSISTPSASVANNLDCLLSQISNIELIYLRIIFMITLILFTILIVSLGIKLLSIFNKTHFDLSIITNIFLYLFVTNQATLIKSLSSLIAIRTISDQDYIQGNVSMLFYQENHLKWIFSFILPCLLIFGIVIPLILFFILLHSKNQINEVSFREHFGYLFNDYNKQNQFWEQIRILVRTIIIILLTSFETNINLKATLISLTLIFYSIFTQNRKPYNLNNLNKLDIYSNYIVIISIFLASVKYLCEYNDQNNNQAIIKILQIILVFLLIVLCWSYFIRIVKVYSKKYLLLLLNFLNQRLQHCRTLYFIKFIQRIAIEQICKTKQTEKHFEKLRTIIHREKSQTRRIYQQPLSTTSEQQRLTQFFFSSSPKQ